jgi:hypothetical protein
MAKRAKTYAFRCLVSDEGSLASNKVGAFLP